MTNLACLRLCERSSGTVRSDQATQILMFEQRTSEWFEATLGIPTVSDMARVVTHAQGTLSKQADGYIAHLLAHRVSQELEQHSSQWLERGTALKPETRDWYSLNFDLDNNGFDTQKTITTTTFIVAGYVLRSTITFTAAEADDVAGGDDYRLRIERLATDVNDTLTNDAQIFRVRGRQ